jgi:hypothetical protein
MANQKVSFTPGAILLFALGRGNKTILLGSTKQKLFSWVITC